MLSDRAYSLIPVAVQFLDINPAAERDHEDSQGGTANAGCRRVSDRESADHLNALTEAIIGAGIEVHRQLGAGLLESAYVSALEEALQGRGLKVDADRTIKRPGLQQFSRRYRPDLIVDDSVVVEVKAVERILPVHAAQLGTYLRLTDCPVGLILNFNVALLKDGIKRVVNDFPDAPGEEQGEAEGPRRAEPRRR